MFSKHFILNEQSLSVIEQFGEHMPGGFFIYKAGGQEELLYANKAVCHIFGCDSLEDFKAFSGFTFRGMVHPEDYERVSASIKKQINESRSGMDVVEYRIIRRDGETRWIDDYGHFVESDVYQGGLYYVFISDVTDKYRKAESDKALRSAVIEALTRVYDSVWLISDLEKQRFELYRIDEEMAINAEIAIDFLEMTGLDVDWAQDGKQAAEMLAASPDGYYSMIFMDIQMPDMDGYEATQLIRAMDRRYAKEIPIVAMTANAFAEDVLHCKEAGMNDHLTKPIDVEALARVLDTYVK